MKILAPILLICTVGCTNKQPAQPMLHIVSFDNCARPQLVGTIGKMRYSLNSKTDEKTAMSVACPNPGQLGLKDIGKDYPVVVDLDRAELTLTLPEAPHAVFEIDHMQEQ